MNSLPLVLAAGAAALLLVAYLLFAEANPAKEGQRRLQAVRLRHSDSAVDRVESQLKKAIAARKPATQRIAGSSSQIAALALRLERSGTGWTLARYLSVNAGLALAVAALVYLRTGAGLLAIALGILMGLGVPHLVVGRLVKRRLDAFNARLPDAIELLVRGLRSGLPVSESLAVIASEVPGPVGAEFRAAVERIKIGSTMEEALQKTADKLGTPEFQFFVISLAVQRETGGNLAETLSNLADVLRKRSQMKLKIRAMSSEAKASAYIVGALPFFVFTMIWWINPAYVGGFFEDDRLIVTGVGGMVWMGIGGFIMARMVSFEV